jgi:hypothetical protein
MRRRWERLALLLGTAMWRALFAALLILIAPPPARAEVRILASPGGEVGTYLELFAICGNPVNEW